MNRTRIKQSAMLAAWLFSLIGIVALLSWLGRQTGTALPLQHPASWRSWAVKEGTPIVVFSVLRLLAMASGIWLVLMTILALSLRAIGWTAAACRAEALTLPLARRLIAATMGLSLSAPALGVIPPSLATASIGSAPINPAKISPAKISPAKINPAQQTPQLVALGPEQQAPRPQRPVQAQGPAQAQPTSARLEAHFFALKRPARTGPVSTGPVTTSPVLAGLGTATPSSSPKAAGTTLQAAGTPDRTAKQWTVRAGDDFWSIASTVLNSRLGRSATDAEIEAYSKVLVSANLTRLAHPSEPQLIFPGQVFVLPSVSFESG